MADALETYRAQLVDALGTLEALQRVNMRELSDSELDEVYSALRDACTTLTTALDAVTLALAQRDAKA